MQGHRSDACIAAASGCSERSEVMRSSAKGGKSGRRTNPTSGTLDMVLLNHAPTPPPPPPLCSARTTTAAPARPHTCRRCRAASGAHGRSAFVDDDSRPTAAACIIADALTEEALAIWMIGFV